MNEAVTEAAAGTSTSDGGHSSWPAVVVVAFVVAWAVVGVRGLVNDDSRFAWGMFPYALETSIEDVRFLDEHGVLIRTWKPPHKPSLQRFFRSGGPQHYGYAAGAYLDLVEQHLLPRAAQDAPAGAATVSTTITLVRSERAPVTHTISIPISAAHRARGAARRTTAASTAKETPAKKKQQPKAPSNDDEGSP